MLVVLLCVYVLSVTRGRGSDGAQVLKAGVLDTAMRAWREEMERERKQHARARPRWWMRDL